MKDVILSIIIPFYNADRFIETAITSVLNSDKDFFELILVNDGSIDSSETICKSFNDNRIMYLSVEPNQGAGHAREVGLKHANGKWVIFLDADDILFGDFLVDKLEVFLKNCLKENVDIVYTPIVTCDMKLDGEVSVRYPEKYDRNLKLEPQLEFVTCIYNLSFLTDNNIHFYEYRKQDVESAFRIQVFTHAKKIRNAEDIFYYLRRRNMSSNMHTYNIGNMSEIKGKVYYDLYEKSDKSDDMLCAYLYSTYFRQLKKLLAFCFDYGYDKELKQQLNDLLKLYKISWKEASKYNISHEDRIYGNRLKYFIPILYPLFKLHGKKTLDNTNCDKNSEELTKDNSVEILKKADEINKRFPNLFQNI